MACVVLDRLATPSPSPSPPPILCNLTISRLFSNGGLVDVVVEQTEWLWRFPKL